MRFISGEPWPCNGWLVEKNRTSREWNENSEEREDAPVNESLTFSMLGVH